MKETGKSVGEMKRNKVRYKRIVRTYVASGIRCFIIIIIVIITIIYNNNNNNNKVDLGGLGVTCSPRYPRFADSNPAEVDGFFRM